jgi:hypothetical protein
MGDVAKCNAAAAAWANVGHDDRVCVDDAECVPIVADGGRFLDALNKKSAALPKYKDVPCTNPAGGPCRDTRAIRARCVDGCCRPQL